MLDFSLEYSVGLVLDKWKKKKNQETKQMYVGYPGLVKLCHAAKYIIFGIKRKELEAYKFRSCDPH